jgi:ferredoxin
MFLQAAKPKETTNIIFKPQDAEQVEAVAKIGAPLEVTAEEANVQINYKCKKGECGTCEVMINGRWERACQTTIPSLPPGEEMVIVVPKNKKKNAGFFTPASFVEGVVNNGLGVVGFVDKCSKADAGFDERMERERKLAELVAKKKAQK